MRVYAPPMTNEEYERIWRAMYDHRLMDIPEKPGITYADVCTCKTAIYSTPGYYIHIWEVAHALTLYPNATRITEQHLKGLREWNGDNPHTYETLPPPETFNVTPHVTGNVTETG
jgi:hypothetical protein